VHCTLSFNINLEVNMLVNAMVTVGLALLGESECFIQLKAGCRVQRQRAKSKSEGANLLLPHHFSTLPTATRAK